MLPQRWLSLRVLRILIPVVLLVLGGGCTSYRLLRQAELAEAREEWDRAVMHYLDLVSMQPGNVRYRTALLRAKMRAAQAHFQAGRRFAEAGALERALLELQQAVNLDPSHQYAQTELEKVRAALARRSGERQATVTLDELKQKSRARPAQPPVLNPRSKTPISLEFPKPQSIFKIYQALGKAFGINVLFDPQLKDQDLAIELREVTAQTALETLMRAAGHFYKVIDERTILIAADNPQNRKNYEDLVIQTFFLSNADAKTVVSLIRSLIGTRNMQPIESLNAITIRDTADKVKVAERIIEGIDKARAEVIVDIELIQVNTTKLRELGLSLSANQITQTLDLGEDVPIRLGDLRYLNQNSWTLTLPSILYDFVKTNSDAQLLAKPQLRISEGEKGKVHIGDRVPIPVTSFNTSNTTGGGAIVPVTSFQYQDIGIRIEIEPRVHHNKEVTLKLQVEVSQISGFQDAGGGQRQPVIGTRTIESTIRLKDGETNFLAGLIRTDEANSETGIPGLSDIPILGRLFGKNSVDVKRTDVMLTLTPRIIRTPDVTLEDLLPIWVGTEANITFRGGSPRVESEVEGPFDQPLDPEAEQKLREQLERLPRGLREQAPPSSPPAGGVTLAPGSAPSNPFARPQEKQEKPEPPEPPPGASAALSGAPLNVLARAASLVSMGPAVTLSLEPQAVSVASGDRFAAAVRVASTVPIAHLPMTLTYDPSRLELLAVRPGDFLGSLQVAEISVDSGTPGQVVLGASRKPGLAGVAGRGTLVELEFRALQSGRAAVEIAAHRVMDPELAPVAEVEVEPLAVEVRSDPWQEEGGGEALHGGQRW